MQTSIVFGNAEATKRIRITSALAILAILVCVATVCLVYEIPVFGLTTTPVGEDEELTVLFSTEAFRGAWDVITKVNFLGAFLNGIISIFCFLGLFLTVMGHVISLLYLSNPEIFNEIHETKSGGDSGGAGGGGWRNALGWQRMVAPLQGSKYTGLDAIFHFLAGLLPDIKEYSHYKNVGGSGGGGGENRFNLSENDKVADFIMKTAISTVMIVFFFTIGFNGTLWKSYGVVVNAMATAADNFCEVELDSIVQGLIDTESGYKFHFNASGSNFGDFQQKVAKDMYAKTVKCLANRNQEDLMQVGNNINKQVTEELTKAKVRGRLGVSQGIAGNTITKSTEAYASALGTGVDAKGDKDMSKVAATGSTDGKTWADYELWDGSDQTAKGLKATVTITNNAESLAGFGGTGNGVKYGPDLVIPLNLITDGKELKHNTNTGNLTDSQLYVHCFITIKGTNTKNYISIRDNNTDTEKTTGKTTPKADDAS